MKKVTLQDGTEIEIMEASDVEEATKKAVEENTKTLTEDFDKKLEEIKKESGEDGDGDGSGDGGDDKGKKPEEDPFITQLKKEQDEKLDQQIKDASYNNADLEAEIRNNLKSLEGSNLNFTKALELAQGMAVNNNPEKGFADIISAGGEGNDNAYTGGEGNQKTLNPAVAKMLKSSIPGLKDDDVQDLYQKTTTNKNNN